MSSAVIEAGCLATRTKVKGRADFAQHRLHLFICQLNIPALRKNVCFSWKKFFLLPQNHTQAIIRETWETVLQRHIS